MPLSVEEAAAKIKDHMNVTCAPIWENADPAFMEELGAWYAVPENKAAADEEMKATFQAADTNNDGLLNLAEFMDFSSKSKENEKARFNGKCFEYTEEISKASWEIINTFNPDTDGVSFEDLQLYDAASQTFEG